MRLIHLTDPHLSSLADTHLAGLRGKQWLGYQSWWRRRRHVHQRTRLDQVTNAVLALEPDRLCITGDLVHIGLETEHQQAREWLEQLGDPARISLSPGNHDLYTARAWSSARRLWSPWLPACAPTADSRDAFPHCANCAGVAIVTAHSSPPVPWYSAQGELGQAQRERLHGLARSLSHGPRILLIHHPVVPPAAYGQLPARKALRDAGKAADTFAAYDVILHGHIHHNHTYGLGGSRVFCTASASAPDASFRVFDFAHDPASGHWQACMTLHTLRGNAFEATTQTTWTITRD